MRTVICVVCGRPVRCDRPNIKYHVRCRDEAKRLRNELLNLEPVPQPVARPDSHYKSLAAKLWDRGVRL